MNSRASTPRECDMIVSELDRVCGRSATGVSDYIVALDRERGATSNQSRAGEPRDASRL